MLRNKFFFISVCIDHYYGFDCSTPCGKCTNNSVCNKVTGHCPNGCQSHWKGEKCNSMLKPMNLCYNIRKGQTNVSSLFMDVWFFDDQEIGNDDDVGNKFVFVFL